MEPGSSPAAAAATSAAAPENIVDKYKRLLSLARSSLEANQAALKQKDAQIEELTSQLEEERTSSRRRHGSGPGGAQRPAHDDGLDAAPLPRTLLRRVDVDDVIWILVEYEGAEDAWLSFTSEQELGDYITCTQAGVPLSKPPKSLSQADSTRIEEECRARLERITEEFRRYKLRAEIARKQKDAETRQVPCATTRHCCPARCSPILSYPLLSSLFPTRI